LEHEPELIIVAGDVNSTLACALAATKLNIPVAHVEAGLRSYDRTMPEEINRVLTDHISDLLFTTEPSGKTNLINEGIPSERIYFVGNSMIDTLIVHLPKALEKQPWQKYGFLPNDYGVVTLHRPSNVDDPRMAARLAKALQTVAVELPLIFPMHPRTLARSGGVWGEVPGVLLVEPLGYLEFLGLMARAQVVITDSGGIQEETTALGVPCITVRHNTERPITLTQGTNRLVPPSGEKLTRAIYASSKHQSSIPHLWDGQAGKRIIDHIETWLANHHIRVNV
jgi:UDP-N-acetylglucosamine 2-epimerase (non-hydrolysing)